MPIPVVEDVATTTMAAPGTSIAANLPPSSPAGALWIVHIWGGGTFTPPSGYNLIRAQGETTFGSGESRTYEHIVDGSEGSTATFSWTDSMYGNAEVTRISGHAATGYINTSNGAAGANTDTPVSPAVTTTAADCLILRTLATDRISVSPVSPPSGHTEIWDVNGAVSFDASASAGATIGQASAGDSGTATFTMAGARPTALQTIAIAGAAGAAFQLGPAALTSKSVLSGSLSVKNGLAGALTSHSTLTASLSLKNGLVGSLTSHSVLSGSLSIKTGLAGVLASRSELAATLSLKNGLAGTLVSRSTLLGSLSIKTGLSGSLTSHSALSGTLSIGGFQGVLVSRSSLSGSLSVRIGLSGSLASRSALTGFLGLRIGLSGVIASRSSLTGSLTTGSEIRFDDPSINDLTPTLSLNDISPILRII